MSINYINSDLFEGIKQVDQNKKIIIPHVCNDMGGFGSGFAGEISKHFPNVKELYHKFYNHEAYVEEPFGLGTIQVAPAGNHRNINFINMIAQHNVKPHEEKPIRYGALVHCMEKIFFYINRIYDINNTEIHAPKFGSGLAGGDWSIIESLINEIWVNNKIKVNIYEFKLGRSV